MTSPKPLNNNARIAMAFAGMFFTSCLIAAGTRNGPGLSSAAVARAQYAEQAKAQALQKCQPKNGAYTNANSVKSYWSGWSPSLSRRGYGIGGGCTGKEFMRLMMSYDGISRVPFAHFTGLNMIGQIMDGDFTPYKAARTRFSWKTGKWSCTAQLKQHERVNEMANALTGTFNSEGWEHAPCVGVPSHAQAEGPA